MEKAPALLHERFTCYSVSLVEFLLHKRVAAEIYISHISEFKHDGAAKCDKKSVLKNLKWNNNKKTRLSLLAISNYWDNFDGYSIRYAYNVLKKRREPNKIMIVISDGQPSCNRCSGGVGIADARAAVNEARRNSTLLGVCIGGDYNADSLRMIYGNGLLTVNDLSELFLNISSKLRKIVKQEI